MAFNSLSFLLFFIAFAAIYFLLSHRYRWIWLLAGSCVFYMCFNTYGILLFGAVITFNYFSGIAIERSENKNRWVVLACFFNIAWLFLFKYFNFFNSNVTELLKTIGVDNPVPYFNWIIPIGISYYIFQAIGYNVDISREMQPAEKHFGIFAANFLFFPKVAQGPIERPRNLLPQFAEKHDFDYARVTSGIKLIAWGLFKKAVIADRLALLVNQVYDHPQLYSGLPLIIAGLCYAIQLYADFSGYTDMALGVAEVLGFKLMRNFNRPFVSTSVTDFWKRWHISFSTWLYEYIYNPIALLKRNWGIWGMVYAIMITFFISGVWHGVGWIFMLWGVINGIALSYEVLTVKFRKKFWKKYSPRWSMFWCKLITFSFTILSFTFARANNLSDAGYIFSHLFDVSKKTSLLNLGLDKQNIIIALAAILMMEVIQYYQSKGSVREMISSKPIAIRWAVYYSAIFIIILFGVFENRQFIYFQF